MQKVTERKVTIMLCHDVRDVGVGAIQASHTVDHGRGVNMVYWDLGDRTKYAIKVRLDVNRAL